jgi:hypothetical protein
LNILDLYKLGGKIGPAPEIDRPLANSARKLLLQRHDFQPLG